MRRSMAGAILLGVLTAATAAFGSAPAPRIAGNLTMNANEVRMTAGSQFSDLQVVGPGDDAHFDARFDPDTGEVTDGELTLPPYSTHVDVPISADVTISLDTFQPIEGTFDATTGALVMEARVKATVTALGATCIVTTTPRTLTLSTAGTSVGTPLRTGSPFTSGLTGAGAVAAHWNDASAAPKGLGDAFVCGQVDGQVNGPGGVWMNQAAGGGTFEPGADPGDPPDDPGDPPANPGQPGAGGSGAPAGPVARAKKRCPKRKVRKRGRCVKKAKKHRRG